MTCTQDMCHCSFAHLRGLLSHEGSRITCASTLNTDHHMCADRRKELVHTSRFVRVIRGSEDQPDWAQDRDFRRRTLLAVQAIGDPPFNSCVSTRSHHKRCLIHGGAATKMPCPASVSCPCIRRSFLPCLWRCYPRAPLPHRCFQTPSPPRCCCGHSAYKVHVSRLHVPCVWDGFGAVGRFCTQRLHRCFLHCYIAVLTCCRGAARQQASLCLSGRRDNVIPNITAENHPDTFRHLHQRKNKHGIFHLRSLTKHHGRRVDTSCLWCDADCMRLRMHMSENRQHKGSKQRAQMRRKEQTNWYHRGGAIRSRCQSQPTVLLNPFC